MADQTVEYVISQNGIDNAPLYDPNLLVELDFENQCKAQYNPVLSPQNPGEGLHMRPLCKGDYDKDTDMTKHFNLDEWFRSRFLDKLYQYQKQKLKGFREILFEKCTNTVIYEECIPYMYA
ncbi:hypothetical protein KUTeg_013294 [Tegillarca granosa]|uniref:Uncharacterized protein n=1 Tax=Tegillarca granosa TaxID=220873 RepID=A0ABQ9ETD7_TEGGR|nr:hypothetical protein KUTeg_013294 [Tegillarca granosa]